MHLNHILISGEILVSSACSWGSYNPICALFIKGEKRACFVALPNCLECISVFVCLFVCLAVTSRAAVYNCAIGCLDTFSKLFSKCYTCSVQVTCEPCLAVGKFREVSLPCGIFLAKGSNLSVLHCQADSLPLSHQRSPASVFL